ncbi:hypothetical protein BEH94_11225 [Candidatus Altiarchaeales archaeon WOR_SM1_SCG]|nr:hypothetical protein BEH94_11225 [Candidatus Altiarchaeales archaeon WOR_SM1_SCG]
MDAEKIEMVNMIETDNNNCNYVCIRAGLYLSGANVLYEDSVSDFTYDITDRSSQRVTAIIDYSDLSIKHYDHLIKLEVYEGKCRKDLDISDKLDYKWTKSFTHKCLDTEGYCQ